MATPQPQQGQQVQQQSAPSPSVPNGLDRYVVIHVATTCDEHGVYVTKDSAEVIEIGWILLDAKTCDEIKRESILVKPVNTPITPLCTSLTTLTWEHVRTAGSFRDAISRFDQFSQEFLPQNLEFAFVTLDSWDLRVQLPREARDKAVVLPPYLQHSRTFDLRTEYQHWQQYHPESLPFGPSSLTNICAALEVEPVQASAPIKHNLPFHLQSLAPASPRRAMEEAVTLARVLKGLLRKSQPYSDHPDVLTHPMDARADVRAFLSERSKVLHMNGLPHDTTQSELESWFTQFGGRPIAFWTIRTPDQHKPTGTGFAIFSSHEEAAESLCMNGRALNEKAIEVSPSSSRVLDRAAEVLTPFPPSKNRPRPGDWTCPSCGFSNFQRRTACFRCSYPAASAGPPSDPTLAYSYGYPPAPPPMMSQNNYHTQGALQGRSMNALGATAPFRPGDWRCPVPDCLYHNFAKNVSCLRCGAPRVNAQAISEGVVLHTGPPHAGMDAPYMTGHPGPGALGAPGGFSSNPAGFPGQTSFGPASSYGIPSSLGGPNPYGHMSGFTPNGAHAGSGFDSRATEAAFTGAGSTGPGASQGGPGSGAPGFANGAPGGFDAHGGDPFSFLGPGLAGLNLEEAGRRNGAVGGAVGQPGKSPV